MVTIDEAIEHYRKASQGYTVSGQRRKASKRRPLLALTGMIEPKNMLSTVELGIREVRLERVVGTYYATRGHAFSEDFIPRYNERSEIFQKWINLCKSQLEEGINEPIIVYEYLNKYYVQEGNKRVSVLKYFDAVSVAANVIRIIPPYNEEDPEIEVYYSFLDFFAKTDYEDIWFSYVGGFDELIEHMDHYIEGEPTLEAYKDYLKSYYSLFRRIYKSALEEKYSPSDEVTTGDIFLTYVQLFGEEAIDSESLDQRLAEVMSQFVADEMVEVEEELQSSFTTANLLKFKKTRIAFVFSHGDDATGWNKDHLRAYYSMVESFGKQLVIDKFERLMEAEAPLATLRNIAGNYDVVFLVENNLAEEAKTCAVDYPKTIFLVCGGMDSTYLLPSYYGKTYQANFLLGLYAAMSCETDLVGYVSRKINHKIYRSIRAFEAGFKSIRPTGHCQFVKEKEALQKDICLWASYRTQATDHLTEGTVNTYLVKRDQKEYVAYTYWQWKVFYENIFARLIDGTFRKLWQSRRDTNEILFFNWGIGTNVLGIQLNTPFGNPASQLIFEAIKKDIIDGRLELSYLWDVSEYEEWCRKHDIEEY
jgi:basic membrane lipoprotein Med (substrate-binding protein (PBP1-ABC) superfamily)